MKYLSKLSQIGVFTFSELVNIVGNKNTTKAIRADYLKKGYIRMVKKNLYATVSLQTGGVIPNKFQIASKINSSSFVSHHSAFEYYGCYNQVYSTINVSSKKQFSTFTFEGNEYHFTSDTNELQIDEINDSRVTSLERTIIDSINDMDRISDTEEVVKCIEEVSFIKEEKLLQYLDSINSYLLYKKTGFILSFFKDKLHLTDSLFIHCKEKSKNMVGGYLNHYDKAKFVHNAFWNFYTYKDLLSLIKQGEEENV